MIEERRYSKRERHPWVPHVTRTVCIGVRETSARCKETIRIADGTYLHKPRQACPCFAMP